MTTPYDWLAKIYTKCSGHMIKMATMPIYGKNSLNIFKAIRHGILVCSLGDVGPSEVCTNDETRLTLTYFMARLNLIPNAFIWGKS